MNYKIFLLLVIIIPFFSNGQSDYEIVQNFKQRYQEIENKIKEAGSLEELQNLSIDVSNLKNDFVIHRGLLDKSLYPENFQKIIDNLNNSIVIRKSDFTQIEELQTEVINLRTELDELNKKNTELLNKIYILEIQRKKDTKTIAELQNLVNQLRASLAQRDELVYSIIDSLIPKFEIDTKTLTDTERENLVLEAENKNVLFLVKKMIRDNNRFLQLTSLKPEDIESVKQQQENFVTLWQKIGPKLVDVYVNKPDKSRELKQIDELYVNWKNTLKKEIWESIRDEFLVGGINLKRFYSGDDFTNEIITFIDKEIKDYNLKAKEESERIFSIFADSIWFKTINSDWMPYLVDNNMITQEQKDSIDKKISEWKEIVAPSYDKWIYLAIALVLIVVIIFLVIRLKRKNNNSPV